MLSPDRPRKRLEKRDNFRPVLEITTCKFTDNEGMAHYPAFMQQCFQSDGPMPQMRYPDRSVNQDHVMILLLFGGG